MAGLPLATVPPEVLTLSSFWGWERIGDYFGPLLALFLKTGTLIFGGGLVIIPLLEYEVVERLQWLTRSEFINGIAIGQLSPGPVVLTAAFIGFKVAGLRGALVASISIFTPSFLFIMAGAPILLRIRQNLWVQAFLKAVRPAVLGAIAVATIPLMQTAIVERSAVALGAIAAAIGFLSLHRADSLSGADLATGIGRRRVRATDRPDVPQFLRLEHRYRNPVSWPEGQ